ncbi:hypothetical protein [Haloferula sargassicola]|uniref:Fibronectin type-III domain-containing protein n=1 Tax=Haloferula sargassicola TaxID=490096 RepID=A0ABP9USQ4_9BACT
MNTSRQRVNVGFAQASDHVLEARTHDVLVNLYGNAAFATPPVAEADLREALTAFSTAMADMAQGGTANTAVKNEKRQTLIGLMRTLAGYVQDTANNNLAVILSSGFEAVSKNRASETLAAPVILAVQPAGGGRFKVNLERVTNAKSYQIDVAILGEDGAPGDYRLGALSTRARGAEVGGLIPGKRYSLQARAIGGATGSSDWSLPVTQWSM